MSGASTSLIPWKPDFLEFFDLASPAWGQPAVLRRTVNAARSRIRLEAVFVHTDGGRVKLSARLRKEADGGWTAIEERLERKFIFRPEPLGKPPGEHAA